ncbi:unnamed protein product, partial [Chrysoparadoxa australica]
VKFVQGSDFSDRVPRSLLSQPRPSTMSQGHQSRGSSIGVGAGAEAGAKQPSPRASRGRESLRRPGTSYYIPHTLNALKVGQGQRRSVSPGRDGLAPEEAFLGCPGEEGIPPADVEVI